MIVLPWPPAELSSNARGHWAKKASATRKYRDDAMLCALAAKAVAPAEGEIALTIRFVPPNNRMDRANYPAMVLRAASRNARNGGENLPCAPSRMLARPRKNPTTLLTIQGGFASSESPHRTEPVTPCRVTPLTRLPALGVTKPNTASSKLAERPA